jgi:putative transposase
LQDIHERPLALVEYSEAQRAKALERFRLLRPFLEEGVPLTEVVSTQEVSLATARRWVARYRQRGLAGLTALPRRDRGYPRCMTEELKQLIEGLALKKPRMTAAAIHRKVAELMQQQARPSPSYSTVYAVIHAMHAGLMTLAHQGSKTYRATFDLLYRHEADKPNALWQADHTLLDIWLLNEQGAPRKPWLTVIMDDYSRAIAGYYLAFSAPSALQTALALRQAIWRKAHPAWHICGIPEILYTDHGSDFTSEHMEQVCAALKIQLVLSLPGQPRGRGKIERFFNTVNQMLLCRLNGYTPNGSQPPTTATLTLAAFTGAFETFMHEHHQRCGQETRQPPQARWEANGFLPRLPPSLEELDLLLLTVSKTRRVRQDGIHFQSLRYVDLTLAAYVGEDVVIRYDPRDMAEIRVYYDNHFLCRAICPDLAAETISLKDIIAARNKRRRDLHKMLRASKSLVEALLGTPTKASMADLGRDHPAETLSEKTKSPLKRYFNE